MTLLERFIEVNAWSTSRKTVLSHATEAGVKPMTGTSVPPHTAASDEREPSPPPTLQ